jgi:hypothetical protein
MPKKRYKPKKTEEVPTKYYDDKGKPISSKEAIKRLKERKRVRTTPKKH